MEITETIKSLIIREYLWNGDDDYQVCDGVETFTGEDMTEEEWDFYDMLLERDGEWGVRESLWFDADYNYVEQNIAYSEKKVMELLVKQN